MRASVTPPGAPPPRGSDRGATAARSEGRRRGPARRRSGLRLLIDEVDRLPERFRAPIVLHYFEGLTAEATARRLGCARGTVLSRLSRARDRLRRGLERRGFSLDAVGPVGGWRIGWPGGKRSQRCWSRTRSRAGVSLGLAARRSKASCRPPSPRWRTGWPGRWCSPVFGRRLVFSYWWWWVFRSGSPRRSIARDEPSRSPATRTGEPGSRHVRDGTDTPQGTAHEDSLVFRGRSSIPTASPSPARRSS